MDIKLKNRTVKRTIGAKLLVSYMAVLLVTFIVSLIVYNNVSKTYLVNQAKESMDDELIEIMRFVKMATGPRPDRDIADLDKVGETIAKARLDNEMRLAGRYFDSKIAVVTDKGRIRYTSVPGQTIEDLVKIEAEAREFDSKYILKKESIRTNNMPRGYVIIYTAVEDVVSLRNLGFKVFTLSFSIGGLLALVISLFFQKMIGKPIRKLSHAMKAYSFNAPVKALDIHTGDEIEELARTFENMSEKIQTYHGQQKVFFQNASHELKTPLMSIQGYAEAIKDQVVEGHEKEESLDIIITESQRLKKIVEEMILMTKLEDKQEAFKLQSASIEEILQGAVRSLKSLFSTKGVKVHLNLRDQGTSKFDVEKLTRAFINILGNCARYARTGIHVDVYEDHGIHIKIYDDGPGFSPGECEKVFERFYRGQGGGSGIGLSLTKTIIERHGGTIAAENGPKGGAVFKIDLPKK
ncbi:ATP-binding protein [Fusibacter sp. JL216-2]|uniref:sensor histidine kinase n=1 Tax=Fusibacter sp. JL216-2 TaxID=3071453 RepID=UPI003D3286B6